MEQLTAAQFFDRFAYTIFTGGRVEGGAVVLEFMTPGGREQAVHVEQSDGGPAFFVDG